MFKSQTLLTIDSVLNLILLFIIDLMVRFLERMNAIVLYLQYIL